MPGLRVQQPAAKPSDERAAHLSEIAIPMLFLQGANDALAEIGLLRRTVVRLEDRATLELVDAACHDFHVPAKTGRKDVDILTDLLRAAAKWMVAR